MIYEETHIKGVWTITPKVFNDERGYFFEVWKQSDFDSHVGYHVDFVQDNESKSSYGVLRGLHYQKGPYSQAKLVRVIKGRVIDVAVDLRRSSPTFGQHVAVELSEDNKRQLFIPRGFAHGFLVLSKEAVFTYKVDNLYAPQHEASIRWNDETVGIKWPIDPKDVVTSEKDLKGKSSPRLMCLNSNNAMKYSVLLLLAALLLGVSSCRKSGNQSQEARQEDFAAKKCSKAFGWMRMSKTWPSRPRATPYSILIPRRNQSISR